MQRRLSFACATFATKEVPGFTRAFSVSTLAATGTGTFMSMLALINIF